jgi:hypothetical protein
VQSSGADGTTGLAVRSVKHQRAAGTPHGQRLSGRPLLYGACTQRRHALQRQVSACTHLLRWSAPRPRGPDVPAPVGGGAKGGGCWPACQILPLCPARARCRRVCSTCRSWTSWRAGSSSSSASPRCVARHGLSQGHPKPLVGRGLHVDRRPPEQVVQLCLTEAPCERHVGWSDGSQVVDRVRFLDADVLRWAGWRERRRAAGSAALSGARGRDPAAGAVTTVSPWAICSTMVQRASDTVARNAAR